MSRDRKQGEVVPIPGAGDRADSRRQAKREAKARDLKQRFAAARSAAEPKSKAATRLLKLFKNPGRNPAKKP